MRNVFTICGKELKSYFTSPIAYLLMALFGLILGYFFASATIVFVNQGLRAQMGGQETPMSINEWVIAPLLGGQEFLVVGPGNIGDGLVEVVDRVEQQIEPA